MTTEQEAIEQKIADFLFFVASSKLEGVEYTELEVQDSIDRIKRGQSSDNAVKEVLFELQHLGNIDAESIRTKRLHYSGNQTRQRQALLNKGFSDAET